MTWLALHSSPVGRFPRSHGPASAHDQLLRCHRSTDLPPSPSTTTLRQYVHALLSLNTFGISLPLTHLHPPTFLSAFLLTYYLNCALNSPLSTPSRSTSDLIVALSTTP